MESQMPSTLWLPTLCQVRSGLPFHEATLPGSKQLIHPVVATQPVLLPSHGGHVLVQMQQMMPLLGGETSPVLHSQHDFLAPNVMVQPVPCLPQFKQTTVIDTNIQQILPNFQAQVCHKLKVDVSTNPLNKIQKKKKISPSAKRRSRLRLIAFLEAKKEKYATCHAQDESDGQKDDDVNGSQSPTSLIKTPDLTTSALNYSEYDTFNETVSSEDGHSTEVGHKNRAISFSENDG